MTSTAKSDRPPVQTSPPTFHTPWRTRLSVERIGTVYLWVIGVAVFSAWRPHIFPNYLTVVGVLNSVSIPGLLALAVIVPLAAGVVDLSVGYTLGLANVLTASLLADGHSVLAAIVITLAVSLIVGVVNGFVVVVMRIDSFIGTLATGSLILALILQVSGNQEITANVTKIQAFAGRNLHLITLPVFVFFAVAIVLWLVLDYSVTGRRIYATGLGREQARLAGIKTGKLQFSSFLVSAFIAGCAGCLLTGIVGAGSPTAGPPYLIPAFAAAFLGATQLKDGLFNSIGTVMATLLLGTLNVGLALATSALWAPDVFNGIVLIAALGLRVTQTSAVSLNPLARLRAARTVLRHPKPPERVDATP
jgi:ribose transport system permease protein